MATKKISFSQIYDKNLNFLFGSGASYGLFPTLSLGVKGENGEDLTVESAFQKFKYDGDKSKQALIFMYYYKKCIEPVLNFSAIDSDLNADGKNVIENYKVFIRTLLEVLDKRKKDKHCNIFTTNYDGCFEFVADLLLQDGISDFVVNDGGRGFFNSILHISNFDAQLYQSGIFGRYRTEIRQLNLYHLHGSVYWYLQKDHVQVDYSAKCKLRLIDPSLFVGLENYFSILSDPTKNISCIDDVKIPDDIQQRFWASYRLLPIVNPTKWKFHETVFEEHYYQMLRSLSIELEKENSVVVVFGFSFKDEHILNLLKRSVTNPSLQVYVCCHSEKEYLELSELFKKFKNIVLLYNNVPLDFSYFNKNIFCLDNELSPNNKESEENTSTKTTAENTEFDSSEDFL